MKIVPVLCVMEGSNYYSLPDLDLYDKTRDCRTWNGGAKLIAHPPCQQWSKMRAFAHTDKEEKELGPYCYELVNKYGGILEHPEGSMLFKHMGADRSRIFMVEQWWWGFRAVKRTWLYCVDVELLPVVPVGNLGVVYNVENMQRNLRSKMPLAFCQYLVDSIRKSY